jgi:hypothetical protein
MFAQAVQEGVILPTWLLSVLATAFLGAVSWILVLMFRLSTSSAILSSAVNELRKQVAEGSEEIKRISAQHQEDRLTLARALGRLPEDHSQATPHHRERA